ncbi:hypothetical protein INR49_014876 [Caranx melampygus]|nr:hypothetical protein INR49_014876 [Caranx melampygus]
METDFVSQLWSSSDFIAELCRTEAARLAASRRLRASRRWRSELSSERSLARGGWPFRGFFGTGGGILLSWTGMTNSLNDRPLSPHGKLQLNANKEQHNCSHLHRGSSFSISSCSICLHHPSIRSVSACSNFRNQRPSRGQTDRPTASIPPSPSGSATLSIHGSGGGRIDGSNPTSP